MSYYNQTEKAEDVNKSTILKAFNTHFFEFLDDIIQILPDNVEVVSAKLSAIMIKKANPTIIIKTWHKYISKRYFNEIQNGDLTYFFEKDYQLDLQHLSNSNEILQIINNIRTPIREMNEVNKEHTKKYIQNLTKLSTLYNN